MYKHTALGLELACMHAYDCMVCNDNNYPVRSTCKSLWNNIFKAYKDTVKCVYVFNYKPIAKLRYLLQLVHIHRPKSQKIN